jgi:hypothetical protein
MAAAQPTPLVTEQSIRVVGRVTFSPGCVIDMGHNAPCSTMDCRPYRAIVPSRGVAHGIVQIGPTTASWEYGAFAVVHRCTLLYSAQSHRHTPTTGAAPARGACRALPAGSARRRAAGLERDAPRTRRDRRELCRAGADGADSAEAAGLPRVPRRVAFVKTNVALFSRHATGASPILINQKGSPDVAASG